MFQTTIDTAKSVRFKGGRVVAVTRHRYGTIRITEYHVPRVKFGWDVEPTTELARVAGCDTGPFLGLCSHMNELEKRLRREASRERKGVFLPQHLTAQYYVENVLRPIEREYLPERKREVGQMWKNAIVRAVLSKL